MRIMLLLLVSVNLLFAIEFNGYSSFELGNMSFSDSLMISSVYKYRGLPDGWVQGGDSQIDTGSTDSTTLFNYRYDSSNSWVTTSGSDTFFLYDQRRVITIQKGYVHTTHISYGENSRTIISNPNDDEISQHSKRWYYHYLADGQVDTMIMTPNDWEYPGDSIYWGENVSDTLTYSYDSQNRKTGAFYISYSRDFSHGFPWKRAEDSLLYEWSTLGDTTIEKITQLSKQGDSWTPKKEDTLWVNKYNSNGQLLHQDIRRWDASLGQWDSLFFNIIEYTYEDSLLISSSEYQYYGDGTSSLLKWFYKYTYGENTLLHDNPTDIASFGVLNKSGNVKFTINGNRSISVNGSSKFNKLVIYDLFGRQLRAVNSSTKISLSGISIGQPLIVVAKYGDSIVGIKRLMAR